MKAWKNNAEKESLMYLLVFLAGDSVMLYNVCPHEGAHNHL